MKIKGDLIRYLIVFVILVICVGSVCAGNSFEVSNVMFKVSLEQGESVTKSLSISDGGGGENFFLNAIAVKGISFSESSFILQEGERKNVDVTFDSSGLTPGVMAGSIEVTSEKETIRLPVIFEVETEDLFFDANLDVPPAYVEVEQGSKLVVQVKIFDLSSSGGLQDGLGAEAVDLEYNIFNLDGSVVSSETEKVIVDKQTQFTKTFSFPKNIQPGDYIVAVNVKYRSSLGASSQIFAIIESDESSGFTLFSSLSDYTFLIIIGIVMVLLLGIILLFFYFIHDRDKLMFKLKRYNSQDLDRQKEILIAHKAIPEKKVVFPKVGKIEFPRKEAKKVKRKHATIVKKVKRLKKHGKSDEMKRKLDEWKSKGYNTATLEYKMNGLGKKDMTNVMEKWKKKYKKT